MRPIEELEESAFQAGVVSERLRLIKLLEEADNKQYYEWLKSDDKNWPDYAEVAIGFRMAIALLKMEKK